MDCPWNFLGQNTGVGSLSLPQGIFPTQESNPGLLHCRRILYQLSHMGSPRILEWVAYSFSSGSSWHQESNRGLLHCRWILYQMSYQGSPEWFKIKNNLNQYQHGAQQTSNAKVKPCFPKFTGLEPKLNPTRGRVCSLHAYVCVWVCVCVCAHRGANGGEVRLLNSITADYHNSVHFSSLPDRVKNCVHLISPTFKNTTVELKVSGAFWLNTVLGNDCFTYFFVPFKLLIVVWH